MKVTLPKDWKDNYYVSQVEQMRTTITALKDYDEKPANILRNVARSWCDEDVDIDEWCLYSFCPYGQNVYDLRAKYDRNATERMAQWFRKMEAQEGEV